MNRKPEEQQRYPRRWLCIAQAFPPVNRSGTHRTLGFVKHLDRLGWQATVVTAQPHNDPIDATLLADVPASASVRRTAWADPVASLKHLFGFRDTGEDHREPARQQVEANRPPGRSLREWLTRLMFTPDSRTGWILPAVRASMAAIRKCRPDVIYSTSPCMSAHLAALLVRLRTGLPWVADFRDPWRDNPFRQSGFASLEWWDGWLERRVLRNASHIVCNTPTMRQCLCARMPLLAAKSTTILNGFDLDSLDGLVPVRTGAPGDFIFMHCGQFYGPRSPAVWFRALRRLLEESPDLARRARLALIGPDLYKGEHLKELARQADVADAVIVLGLRTHAEALARMAGSDALLLAGADGPGSDLQVPNKLFEYVAIGKPILATAAANSPIITILGTILGKMHAPALICPPDDDAAVARNMTLLMTHDDAAQDHVAHNHHIGDDDILADDGATHDDDVQEAWRDHLSVVDRAARATELASIFERLCQPSRPRRGCHAFTPKAGKRALWQSRQPQPPLPPGEGWGEGTYQAPNPRRARDPSRV